MGQLNCRNFRKFVEKNCFHFINFPFVEIEWKTKKQHRKNVLRRINLTSELKLKKNNENNIQIFLYIQMVNSLVN